MAATRRLQKVRANLINNKNEFKQFKAFVIIKINEGIGGN